MVKISVIMAAYNSEDYIGEAIQSVFEQTITDWELIVCDDASTDRTFEILTDIAKNDSRIKVLRNEINHKQAYSRNRCIGVSTGEYIGILDSDDTMKPDKLEKQIDFLEKNSQFAFVGSGAYLFDENGIWSKQIPKVYLSKKDICMHSGIVCASMVIRRTVFEKVSGYRVSPITTRGEDWDFISNMYYNGYCGSNLEEMLYGYRVDKQAYDRRKYSFYIDDFKIRNYWFWKLKMPIHDYIFVCKPLITGLIPKNLMRLYHKQKGR